MDLRFEPSSHGRSGHLRLRSRRPAQRPATDAPVFVGRQLAPAQHDLRLHGPSRPGSCLTRHRYCQTWHVDDFDLVNYIIGITITRDNSLIGS